MSDAVNDMKGINRTQVTETKREEGGTPGVHCALGVIQSIIDRIAFAEADWQTTNYHTLCKICAHY